MVDANRSLILRWSHSRAQVEVALSSELAKWGSRRWALRLSAEGAALELPLGLTTTQGMEPSTETRSAVLMTAGRMLREIGAAPALPGGMPPGGLEGPEGRIEPTAPACGGGGTTQSRPA